MKTAYDYDKQVWVKGYAAEALLAEQIAEEILLLNSEDGDAYAASIGVDKDTYLVQVWGRA